MILTFVVTASTNQPRTSAWQQPRVFSHSAILAGHSGTKGSWSIKKHTKTQGKRQEQTLRGQLCDGLQGSESCDATSHVHALCSYISCLK
jgi:hypothetical protein